MKKLIKSIFPSSSVNWLRRLSFRYPKLLGRTTQRVFTEMHFLNISKNLESISGPGSEMSATENIREALPGLIKSYQIKKMIDIPCGDFHWMRHVNLSELDYNGFDIVRPLIAQNVQRYQSERISFQVKDLLKDDLEKADLIFNRECLVHLSFNDIAMALENIKRSRSTYLLTTTYPDLGTNQDIITGYWRPLNLQTAPFNLPSPELLMDENYSTEKINNYGRKCIGLWKIKNLPAVYSLT